MSLFEISGNIFGQTEKAIKVGINACLWAGGALVDNAEIMWIPKSQIRDFTRHEGDAYSACIPMWMARKNGLAYNPNGVYGLERKPEEVA